MKYMRCVFMGIPIWYCMGILVFMANQFAPEMGIASINPGKAIMWAYIATSISDFSSGWFSHVLKSRKKAILYMLLLTLVGVIIMLFSGKKTENMYYFYCFWIGFGSGFWAMLVTVAAEQFGTNLRSTATTSVPNMIRGSVPLMLIGFDYLKQTRSVIISAAIVGAIAFALGIYATLTISETHNREMDFVE
jgi:threonine/homoserine efflux transporter RhtA